MPILLLDVFKKWEIKESKKFDRPVVAVREIAVRLNLSPATVYGWLNEYNPDYPKVNYLYTICTITDDWRPIDYLNSLKPKEKK